MGRFGVDESELGFVVVVVGDGLVIGLHLSLFDGFVWFVMVLVMLVCNNILENLPTLVVVVLVHFLF